MISPRRLFVAVAAASTFASGARADVDLRRLLAARAVDASKVSALTWLSRRPGRLELVGELRTPSARLPPGAVPINDRWFAIDAETARFEALAASPDVAFHWAPERHLLVDRARGWTKVDAFRRSGGGSGQGVVVGMVDSGADLAHPDLRNRDGSTRVRWMIDFTRPPAGYQPQLESAYGCVAGASCAIYSATDLDRLLANDVLGDEPTDNVGHGTHVTSLAAGNGLSQNPPAYAGVAPEADLVLARVVGAGSTASDPQILVAVRFIFDRARELGEPAAVNLSLGGDLGAHDGSSALERGLSSFVGPDEPGHAIVVAAGNSAGLYAGPIGSTPGPFGIHAEVHVPHDSPVRVPIVTPLDGPALTVRGRVELWVSSLAGDALEIGCELDGHALGAPVKPGASFAWNLEPLHVLIVNGVADPVPDISPKDALVIIDGEWPVAQDFALTFGGHGTASIWVTGEGDLDPSLSLGPLLPRAQKEGTINVPATAPDLIAVGATLNRTDWVDWQGRSVVLADDGALSDAPADSTMYFSSAGPTATGVMKPDIVAPGGQIIGAMARSVDPRVTGNGLFSGEFVCDAGSECLVVDDYHAVASGTSMAAPLVTGAVALLLEREPSLTQPAVRALLQAGARPLAGIVTLEQQSGIGALDVEGALEARLAEDAPSARTPGHQSWIALAASYARPDPALSLDGFADMRDDSGEIADGFDPRRLGLRVEPGRLYPSLQRVAPGLYHFGLSAPAESGGATMRVELTFDGEVIADRTIPIAVDRNVANGVVFARGGCGVCETHGAHVPPWLATSLVLVAAQARVSSRRRRRVR